MKSGDKGPDISIATPPADNLTKPKSEADAALEAKDAAKKQADQAQLDKRKKEREDWEAFNYNKLVKQNVKYRRSGFIKVGEDALKEGKEKDDKTMAQIRSVNGKDSLFELGWYKYGEKNELDNHLLYDEDHTGKRFVKPVPKGTEKDYRAAHDFLLQQGATYIDVDLPKPDLRRPGNEDHMDMQIKLIKEKQAQGIPVGMTLSARTKQALSNMKPEDRERILKEYNKINANKEKMEIKIKAHDDKALKGSDKLNAREDELKKNVKETDPDKAAAEIAEKMKDDAYGDKSTLTEDKQLDAMEKELNRIESDIEEVDKFRSRLEEHLDAQEKLINDPDADPEDRLMKEEEYKEIFEGLEDHYQKDTPYKDKLINNIERKLENLEKQREVWKREVDKLKEKLEEKKNGPKDANAEEQKKKVDKIEGQLKSLESKLAQVQKIEKDLTSQKDKLDKHKKKNTEMPQNIVKAKDKQEAKEKSKLSKSKS